MFEEAGRPAHAMSSMTFTNRTPPLADGDAFVLISHNAGAETACAGAAWTVATKAGLSVVAITRVGGSSPYAVETVEKGAVTHVHGELGDRGARAVARLAFAVGPARTDRKVLGRILDALRSRSRIPCRSNPSACSCWPARDRRSGRRARAR